MNKIIEKIKNNRLFKNFMVLLSGEALVSLIGMYNLAIIVNTIGLENNGIIIMVQTYCLLFNNIFGFKSFQALIKYLSYTIEENDMIRTKQYIKQSYMLDFLATFIATVCGYIFLDFTMKIMNWDTSLKPFIQIFLITQFFNIQGTPIGILRTYNKFNLITYVNIIVNIFKATLYTFGFITKQGFTFFFYTEFTLTLTNYFLLVYFSYITLKCHNLHRFYKIKTNLSKDFFMFNFYSNITSTIDIPVGTLTTMIMNKYLGFSDIAIYKIFEKIGSIIAKLGSPLSQIIYPELNSMVAKKEFNKAKKLSVKLFYGISGLGGAFILFIMVTKSLWLHVFIPNYHEFIIPLMTYLIFIVFVNSTTAIHSLFLALNFIKYNIPILIVINSLYIGLLYFFINKFELNGVIISLFAQAIMVVIIKVIIMKKNNYQEII